MIMAVNRLVPNQMASQENLVWFIIAGFIVVVVECQGQENDCYFSPLEVNEGKNATLTCRFSEDIKEHNKNFYVQISNDSVFKVDERVVVDCAWLKDSFGPSPDCTKSAGYAEPKIDGRIVTIDILNAKQGQAGNYTCFVVNQGSQSAPKSCSFSVVCNEGPGTTHSPVVSNRSDSEPISKTTIGLTTGGCVFVLAAISTALLIYCWCRRKNGKCKRSNAQRGSGKQPKVEPVMLQDGGVRDRIKECEDRDRNAKESSQPLHTKRRKLHNHGQKRCTIL